MSFLTEFGDGGWYGPFKDPDRQAHWYVHAKRVWHHLPLEGTDKPVRLRIRWHVTAEVTPNYVALHWNNFRKNDDGDSRFPTQYPYWNHVPHLFTTLERATGIRTGNVVPMHDIVLINILEEYAYRKDIKWTHKRIRAESEGVALNAHSGASLSSETHEIDITGIQTLTNALAVSAIRSLDLPVTPERIAKADAALLRTLLHEWGTKSYEFIIAHRGGDQIFRSHCYFGTRPDD
jgi:hypothetical protein